jgi:radical SAM superfamily enzyme YgiQ (UPF0313 family)
MKILLIYPNKTMTTRIPIGVGYLISYLKRDGHKVDIFDTTFMKCGGGVSDDQLRASSLQVRNPDFSKYNIVAQELDVFSELFKKIDVFVPDLIGISVVDPNYSFGLELAGAIKRKYKGIFILFGGPTATFAPEEVIAEDCVDAICVGEGEDAVPELCGNIAKGKNIFNVRNIWIKEKGRIYRNDVRPLIDLNTLLKPDWSLFDERHLIRPLGGKMYRMGVFSVTRGCLFRCTYCANFALANIYKNKGSLYRIKRPDLAINEIAECKEKYNLDFAFFVDDIFPLHKQDILDEFCRLYKKDVRIPFNVSLHAELVKEEPFAKLVDAGCCNICVGLESGNPKIRQEVFERHFPNERIINVFKLARKYKVRSSSFNIIGIPHETRRNIFETIELNRKARPTTTTLTFLHPYRGTKVRDLCIRENVFDLSKEKEYEDGYRTDSCLNLKDISQKELNGIFKTFQMYLKMPKILYPLIWLSENDNILSCKIYDFLKKIFYRITAKEAVWDFSKKEISKV